MTLFSVIASLRSNPEIADNKRIQNYVIVSPYHFLKTKSQMTCRYCYYLSRRDVMLVKERMPAPPKSRSNVGRRTHAGATIVP